MVLLLGAPDDPTAFHTAYVGGKALPPGFADGAGVALAFCQPEWIDREPLPDIDTKLALSGDAPAAQVALRTEFLELLGMIGPTAVLSVHGAKQQVIVTFPEVPHAKVAIMPVDLGAVETNTRIDKLTISPGSGTC
jgi:hypothetical protein